MYLVLFDIDGTLVDCGRQVRPLFGGALEETYGTAGAIDTYDFRGKTDNQIVTDLLSAAGLERSRILGAIDEARERYVERLEHGLDPAEIRVLPAVPEILHRLTARPEIHIGLLTGNWEEGARLKLERAGLDGFFSFGAFGDGQPSRDLLPPVAWERAWQVTGHRFDAARTLIVGDSILDVACAKAHGIPSLAVATGWTSAEDLVAAGADWVAADLGEAWGCHPAFGG